MKSIACASVAVSLVLAGCSVGPAKETTTYEKINADLKDATESRAQRQQQQGVLQSLLPPIAVEIPKSEAPDLRQRFNIAVTNASAPQFLNALVAGTRYSMVINPDHADMKKPISLTLKDVTIPEVLNSIREIYGFDYRIEGTLIYVLPAALQTRMFKIDYLTSQRKGTTNLRVSSNAVGTQGAGQGQQGQQAQQAQQGQGQRSAGAMSQSTQVETASANSFWTEMYATLAVLTGCSARKDQAQRPDSPDSFGCDGDGGRRLVMSPQSGTILVRAMPDELKSVAAYLRSSQATVEKQVLIEAKILEVALKDGYDTGINWAGFFSRTNETLGIGQLTPGTQLGTTGSGTLLQGGASPTSPNPTPLTGGVADPLWPLGAGGRALSASALAAGSLFGIAFQGKNFAALMTFLETQGVVHTLSSPRIATLNNQKAVLKVGSDSLFVTHITGGSTQAATTIGVAPTVTSPTFEVQSFFSGIALDVTPRISDDGSVVLHVRPTVSSVSQNLSVFNLGTLGTYTIPLVTNAISETDSVIRAQDGQIVAIGGLMRQAQSENRSQVPGAGNLPFLGSAFRNMSQASEKRELVILLKPTVVQSDETWSQNILESRERMRALDRGFSWGGRSEVFGTQREGQVPQ